MPARSAIAVATMSTGESGSSTQSTGTSWMRSPARSASTSSSVSKNQPVSSTSGSSRRATSARMALKPHWASEKPVPQGAAQDQVVAARDELALRAAHHPGPAAQPGADRQVGVPGDQRGDQRQQRGEVGGQVDVACRRARRRPRRPTTVAQRPAAALLRPAAPTSTVGSSPARAAGDRGGGVGAGVVGDRDPVACRGTARPGGRRSRRTRRLEVGLLVVDGHDHVEHDAAGGGGGLCGIRSGSATSMLMSSRVVGGAVGSLWRTCASTVGAAAGRCGGSGTRLRRSRAGPGEVVDGGAADGRGGEVLLDPPGDPGGVVAATGVVDAPRPPMAVPPPTK